MINKVGLDFKNCVIKSGTQVSLFVINLARDILKVGINKSDVVVSQI